MRFEAIYYEDRLRIVNPNGDVGIVTLWSRVEQAVKVLGELGISLGNDDSRIVAVANLYGNGLPHMLRNLLWNPQIRHILVFGQDLSGSKKELVNFFKYGLEPTVYQDTPAFRIVGTDRIIDGEVTPDHFSGRISITELGKLGEDDTKEGIAGFFGRLPPMNSESIERVRIDIPEVNISRYPTEARNQNILRDTPLNAWRELVFRLIRFGHRNALKKGERVELQNVKVVITNPVEEDAASLAEYGFSLQKFMRYQESILDPRKPPDIEYTYGNRIRGYYQYQGVTVDSLDIAARRLANDLQSRHAYIAVWDNARDLSEGGGCPCLVSLFFRYFEDRLTLTATFRSHNTMDAWLENVYGLISIQRYVANRIAVPSGSITVFSHSISISPDALDKAKVIASAKTTDDQIDSLTGKREPRYDYNGNFNVTVDYDLDEIVVQHSFQGMVLTEYRGKSSEVLENQLARDCALSEISHALYLGREIARKEQLLKKAKVK